MRPGTDTTSKLLFGDYNLKDYAIPNSKDSDIAWFPTSKVNKQAWALDVVMISLAAGIKNSQD
jgi:hypothetical protein